MVTHFRQKARDDFSLPHVQLLKPMENIAVSRLPEPAATDRRLSLFELEDRLKKKEQELLAKDNEIARLQQENRRLSMTVQG
jgi:hypothetical protein